MGQIEKPAPALRGEFKSALPAHQPVTTAFIEEGAALSVAEDGLAEQEAAVWLDLQVIQHRRQYVHLFGDTIGVHARESQLRLKEDQRHAVFTQRVHVIGRLQFLGVVGGDDKERIGIPRLLPRGREELFDSEVGVTDGFVDSERTFLEASTIFVDRKSTRLNSSHLGISYAVFCLKNKR